MTTDLILIYIAGGLTAMLIDKMYARRNRTKTNPIIAFILSWVVILLSLIMYIVDKYEIKWRDL